MTTIVDSHTHIYLEQFKDDIDDVVARAKNSGVRYFFLPNIDVDSIGDLHKLADRFPDNAFPMMGLYPCSVQDGFEEQLEVIKEHLFKPVRKYWAVGEIGIDLHWDKTTLGIQEEAFEQQVNWAKALNLPIVIHVRESFDEVFKLIDRLHDERLRGIFHCFTGTKAQAEKVMEYGSFKMGLGGVLTFKNGKIDKFISEIDPSYLVLETDSPYLAPVPHRGKRNEPSYTKLVLDRLAECTGVEAEELAAITTKNCEDIFNIQFSAYETPTDDIPDYMDE